LALFSFSSFLGRGGSIYVCSLIYFYFAVYEGSVSPILISFFKMKHITLFMLACGASLRIKRATII